MRLWNLSIYTFPTLFIFVSHVAACFCSAFIMITTIVLNSPSFATIWCTPGMKKSTSLFLIMILSGTDAVSGLASHSVFTLRLTSEIFGNVECWILFAQKRSLMLMTFFINNCSNKHWEIYWSDSSPISSHKFKNTHTFQIFVWIVCGINHC